MADHRLAHRRDGAVQRGHEPARARPGSGGGRCRTRRPRGRSSWNSSPSRSPASSKPMQNVASPVWPCSASSATIRLESRPPESSTPTGTSATMRRRTATPQRLHDRAPPSPPPTSPRGAGSRVERRVPVAALGAAGRRARRPARVAGGSLRTPRGSCAARARPSGRTGSGAAPPGRRACRRRRPRRARAATRRSAARRPAAPGQVQRLDPEPVARQHAASEACSTRRTRTSRRAGRRSPRPTGGTP